MNPPPILPADSAPEIGQRVLRAIGGAFGLFFLVFMVWGVIQFGVAAAATNQRASETLGYQAIVTAPAAAIVGLLVGAVLGALAPKGQLRWRILWTTAIFAVVSCGWAAYLWTTTK